MLLDSQGTTCAFCHTLSAQASSVALGAWAGILVYTSQILSSSPNGSARLKHHDDGEDDDGDGGDDEVNDVGE